MYAKIICVCLIAAVLPCLTWASSYVPCTTPEGCKAIMKNDFKLEYSAYFIHMLEQTLYAIDSAARDIEKDLPTDDGRRVELDAIRHDANEHIASLKSQLSDDKFLSIYQDTQKYWQQLRKLNTEGKDIKSHKDRIQAGTEDMYKAIFDIWTTSGKLKRDIVVPGFDEIDVDVQKAKDTAITDENMEFIIGTLTRAMNFYELRKLNVFTYM